MGGGGRGAGTREISGRDVGEERVGSGSSKRAGSREKCEVLNILIYYDYQLSKARLKFGYKVLTLKPCCCHGQLAPFPVATCRPLTS